MKEISKEFVFRESKNKFYLGTDALNKRKYFTNKKDIICW